MRHQSNGRNGNDAAAGMATNTAAGLDVPEGSEGSGSISTFPPCGLAGKPLPCRFPLDPVTCLGWRAHGHVRTGFRYESKVIACQRVQFAARKEVDGKTLLGTGLIADREPARIIPLNDGMGSTYLSRCGVDPEEEEATGRQEGPDSREVPGDIGGNTVLEHLNRDDVAEAASADERPEVGADQARRRRRLPSGQLAKRFGGQIQSVEMKSRSYERKIVPAVSAPDVESPALGQRTGTYPGEDLVYERQGGLSGVSPLAVLRVPACRDQRLAHLLQAGLDPGDESSTMRLSFCIGASTT